MAFTNHETKEIHLKVLYCGPENAGKMTNLQSLVMQTSKEIRSGYFTLAPSDWPYFCFLPLSMGEVGGYKLKLHLYTLPALLYHTTVTSTLLKGVDGLVYVLDSDLQKVTENRDEIEKLRLLFKNENLIESNLPKVFQFNKRDAKNALPVSAMSKLYNKSKSPQVEAVAQKSIGTMETLQHISKQVLHSFESV